MKNLNKLSAAVLLSTLLVTAHASTIQDSVTGLTGAFNTETFTINLPNYSVAGNNFAGVSFGTGNYITSNYDGSFPNMNGQVIANFFDNNSVTFPTFLTFSAPVTGAAFNFVSNPGVSTFTSFIGGVLVESFTENTSFDGNFFGFQNSNFDSIRIDSGGVNNAYILDNLEVQAVPEPESYALMLAGLGALGFVARRRKAL